jgi:hypothetical protein
MAAAKKRPPQEDGPRPINPSEVIDHGDAPDATTLEVIDPPQVLPPDIPAHESTDTGASATKRVRLTRTELSIYAGGAHYSTRAGDIMEVPQPVAADLIAQRVAEEI